MRADRRVACLCVAVTLASQCGCAASRAPHGWLPYAQEAQQEGFGGWIEVTERGTPNEYVPLSGELLAVSNDSVFVLTSAGVGSCALPDVTQATLEGYDPRSGDTSRLALTGTLVSISTGWGLVVFAPLWVVVGTVSSSVLSHQGQHTMDASRQGTAPGAGDAARKSWHDIRLYARFPQGLPAGLDRSQLRMRPLAKRAERTKTMGRRDIVE
jgi:hypothetical protein